MEKERTKILVTVKTYPVASSKHMETVCTAGIRLDGSWVRLYPISYRHMDKKQKFSKYQWIEADIMRDTPDPRPESYKLAGSIIPLKKINTQENWKARKGLVLNEVHTNLSHLINEARDTKTFTSLATFKPAKIIAFSMVKTQPATDAKKKRAILQSRFCEDKAKNMADIIPYKFYYTIIDDAGKRSRMQILDWEIYQLCRKLMRKYGKKKGLVYKHLKAKYFNEFVDKRDIHLFLGTSKYWHIRRSKNPFMIIGIFYPPKDTYTV